MAWTKRLVWGHNFGENPRTFSCEVTCKNLSHELRCICMLITASEPADSHGRLKWLEVAECGISWGCQKLPCHMMHKPNHCTLISGGTKGEGMGAVAPSIGGSASIYHPPRSEGKIAKISHFWHILWIPPPHVFCSLYAPTKKEKFWCHHWVLLIVGGILNSDRLGRGRILIGGKQTNCSKNWYGKVDSVTNSE